MSIKRMMLAGLMAVAILPVFAFNKSMYPYTVPAGANGASLNCVRAQYGMELELGKWYTNFEVCKKYADDNDLPLLAVWSNKSCIHCWYLDVCFTQDSFTQWQAENAAGQVICCFMAGGHDNIDQSGSAAYNWMWYEGGAKLNAYPFVVMWWKKGNVNVRTTGDKMRGGLGLTEADTPQSTLNVIKNLETAFANWTPTPKYAGGLFSDPDTEGNRLEAEAGTTCVPVHLSRVKNVMSVVTNSTLVVKSSMGTELSQQVISWSDGETNKTVSVAIPQDVLTKDGDQLTLIMRDGGVDWSSNHITYVEKECSAANPLWVGEQFGFGDWTCDLDGALDLANTVNGAGYVLVSIQGSMWCPDCANTDRNFLNVVDDAGENRFRAWAKAKNIALVSMDIPNYKGSTVADCASPTLFSKNAYATTIARAKEYPDSGADAALTNAVVRSGLGYLTRKGVSDEEAAKMMKKFHDLAATNTDKGGFHRPEDGNKNRTGVPIFVLLRQDGSVAARFTRFASVSPMASDKANFDAYIKRFEEMLAIAACAGTDAHADATEIENNYPSADSVAFAANGGQAKGELCNADAQDTFRLSGVGGNAIQRVEVKGSSAAELSIQFWKANASGYEAIDPLVTGKLSDGIILTNVFTTSGEYFLMVKTPNVTNAAFNASNPVDNQFVAYTVTGSTILVPQTDRSSANAPADSEFVKMVLVAGENYCFSGIDATANASLFDKTKDADAYAFFTAKVSGIQDVKVSTGLGGKIFYQIWKPGTIGFTATAQTVSESVNDLNGDWLEIPVARQGGSSGRVRVRVAIDAEKTDLLPARYVFSPTEFVWEDGVFSNMIVRVQIIDDLFYDGNQKLVLQLEDIVSEAGDSTIKEGYDAYVLTVKEDDKQSPGRAMISRVEPDWAKKQTLYTKASESVKVWCQRIEASDGLVCAELKSSVADVKFATENPADMTNANGRVYLWWSNREQTEKYVAVSGIPAGKTAKITLASVGTFKTVSGSNTVSIVAVADDAPAFKSDSLSCALYRYVSVKDCAVLLDAATLQGGEVSFTKVSGSLPAGLKAVYDDTMKALAFTGVPTKAGDYEVVYQVVEKRDGKKVSGLVTKVAFAISDPTDTKTNPDANESVSKSRTYKNLAVVNPVNGRLTGTVQLTVPTRGNVSAKYTCESGTISFSTKNWETFTPSSKELTAKLTSKTEGFTMGVLVENDGSITLSVLDPLYPDVQLDASTDGKIWSKTDNAADWAGYYTVALPVESLITETVKGIAPTGNGYLVLKMNTSSAWNAGKVSWAGMLPNGTSISGSAILGNGAEWGTLPIYTTSKTDVLGVYLQILRKAAEKKSQTRRAVLAVDKTTAWWSHVERKDTSVAYLVNLGVYGGIYDTDEDLVGCCSDYYDVNALGLDFDTTALVSIAQGKTLGLDPVVVTIGNDTMSIPTDAANPYSATLSLKRSTGIVTGSFKLPYLDSANAEKTVSVKYAGILLVGWGEGCGCGPSEGPYLPFVNGTFYLSDTITTSAGLSLSVMRGATAMVDEFIKLAQ